LQLQQVNSPGRTFANNDKLRQEEEIFKAAAEAAALSSVQINE
jgi:hypothetical protein